jgi:alpha-mannosidase
MKNMNKAYETNLNEIRQNEIKVINAEVSLNVKPYEIITLEVELNG